VPIQVDSAWFDSQPKLRATFTAFGMTKRAGHSAENDTALNAVVNANTSAVCLVGKTHDFHVETALGIALDENIENITRSIEHLVSQGREALFDAEHFFDGYKANPDYARACIQAAVCSRRTLDRPLRHQWRRLAGRGWTNREGRHRRGAARGIIWAFTPITIRKTRSPIPWPR
jgi:hypothetical protein